MTISLECCLFPSPLMQTHPTDPRALYTWQRCGYSHGTRRGVVSWPYQILSYIQVEDRSWRGKNCKEGFEPRVLAEELWGTVVQDHGPVEKHIEKMQMGRSHAGKWEEPLQVVGGAMLGR